jgi:hypothetical protein
MENGTEVVVAFCQRFECFAFVIGKYEFIGVFFETYDELIAVPEIILLKYVCRN